MTVHGLVSGKSLCRFTIRRPEVWPNGHTWIEADDMTKLDLNQITCEKCWDVTAETQDHNSAER